MFDTKLLNLTAAAPTPGVVVAAGAEEARPVARRGVVEPEEIGRSSEPWEVRHPLATALADSAPGPALTAALADLTAADLSDSALSETVGAWERVISWASARQAEAVAEMVRRTGGSSAEEFVADEVAFTLAVSRRAGQNKVAFAEGLDYCPQV